MFRDLEANKIVKESSSSSSINQDNPSFKNELRVLVADDSKVYRKVLTSLLESLNVETIEVGDGIEVIALFEEGKESFDVVFMDLEMQIMGGIDATKYLRSMGINTTIAGMTHNKDEEVKQRYLEAGIDKFYVKPISRYDVIALLHKVDTMFD